MKLHLPKLLRNSVLACITAVAGIATTTVGTATFTGGVVAFALSSQQAAAAEYTDPDLAATTFANGDVLNLGDGASVNAPLQMADGDSSITLNVTDGTVTWATSQGENRGVSTVNVATGATLDVTATDGQYCVFASKSGAEVSINLAAGAKMISNNLFGWDNQVRGDALRTVNMGAGSEWTINGATDFYLNRTVINLSGGTIKLAAEDSVMWYERRENSINTTADATQMSVISGNGGIKAGNNGSEDGGYIFNVVRGGFAIDATNTADLLMSAKLMNAGNAHGVQKTGDGVMEMTADNPFTHSFFVRAGEMKFTGAGNMASSNMDVAGGAILTLNTSAVFNSVINVREGGTLQTAAGQQLTKNTNVFGTLAVTDTITLKGGTMTFSENAIIDLTGWEGGSEYQIFAVDGGTVTEAKVQVVGVSGDGTWMVDSTGVLSLKPTVEWSSGSTLDWAEGSQFDGGTAYANGMLVTFTADQGDVTATLGGAVSTPEVTVESGTNLILAGSGTLAAAEALIEGDLTVKNTGNDFGSISLSGDSTLVIATGGETTLDGSVGTTNITGGTLAIDGNTTLVATGNGIKNKIITIEEGSTLRASGGGSINTNILVKGTLDLAGGDVVDWGTGNYHALTVDGGIITLGANRQSFSAKNQIVLNNGTITGEGDQHGALDFFENGGLITSSGESTINAPIRLRNVNETTTVNVVDGTLTLSTCCNKVGSSASGNLNKTGAGVLAVTGALSSNGTVFVSAGTLKMQDGSSATSTVNLAGGSLVSAGTVTMGNLTGSGDVTVETAGALTVANASGSFNKLGAGALTITTVTGDSFGMNYEGTLTIGELNLNENAVLTYGNVAGGNLFKIESLSSKVVVDVLSLQSNLATGIDLGLASTISQDNISILGLLAGEYTLTDKDGYWQLTSAAKLHSDWDLNWGAELTGAPTELTGAVITDFNSDGKGLAETGYLVEGRVAVMLVDNGITDVAGGPDTPRAIVGGAYDAPGTNGSNLTIEDGVWIQAVGGRYGAVVGGNMSGNWSNGVPSKIETDSHIVINKDELATELFIRDVVGGNFGDQANANMANAAQFTGDTYVSVYTDSVAAAVVGGSITFHGGCSVLTGDTNVYVYTALANNGGNVYRKELKAVVGGMMAGDDNANKHTLTGNSSVLVDLTGDTTTAVFDKILVGGNVTRNTQSVHDGVSSLVIKGIKADASSTTFNQHVVGGTYAQGGTSTSSGAKLDITGGTYKQYVVGGVLQISSSTSTIGDTVVSIKNATAEQWVTGGTFLNSGSATATQGDVDMTLTDSSFAKVVTGGIFIGGSGTTVTLGDVNITLDGVTLTEDLYGGVYHYSNANPACTSTVGNVSINLTGDGTVSGDIWAAGATRHNSANSTVASTTVTVDSTVKLAENMTISGGFKVNNGTTPNMVVTGDRTLKFSAAQDRSGVTFRDFSVISNAANVTVGNLIGATAATKTGAGVLTLAGTANALTGGLVVSEGSLATATDAIALGGGLTMAAGTTLDVTKGALTLSGALTVGGAFDLLGQGMDKTGEYTILKGVTGVTGLSTTSVAANTIFSSINGMTSLEDYWVKINEAGDLIVEAIIAKTLYWNAATDGTLALGTELDLDGNFELTPDKGPFAADDSLVFGAVTGEASSETVTLSGGSILANHVTIGAGENKVYSFVSSEGGKLAAKELAISSGSAIFAAGSLDLSTLVKITVDGVLDLSSLSAMKGNGSTLITKLAEAATGAGTVILPVAQWTELGVESLRFNVNIEAGDMLKIDRAGDDELAFNVGKSLVLKNAGLSGWGQGKLELGAGVNMIVENGGKVDVNAEINLGCDGSGNKAATITIQQGGTVTANHITSNGGASKAIFVEGGVLELTGTAGIASGISTTVTGGTLKAGDNSWGVSGATIGGVSIVTGSGTITLTDATLTSTIDNSAGKLAFGGAIDITSAGYVTTETPSEYSETGNEGYVRVNTSYVVANTAADTNLSIADDTTWTVDGSATNVSYANGVVTVAGTDWSTDYYVRTDKDLSGIAKTNGEGEALGTIVLTGGGLTMDEALGEGVTIRIEKEGQSVVNIESGLTLLDSQVTGTDATHKMELQGAGTYVLADGTATLGTGVILGDWQGTVEMSNVATTNMTSLLNGLGNANSTVEVTKLSGWFNTDSTTEPGTNPCEVNLKLNNAADGTAAITINNLNSDSVDKDQRYAVLSGDISGSGDIKFISHSTNANVNNQVNYKFTGDVSDWDGAFINAGAHDRTVHVIFAGSATTINADVVNDGNVANCKSKLTIGDDVAASYTMNGEVDVNNLIVNQSTAFNASVTADEVTVNAGTSSMTGGLDVTTLTNNGTLTVSGTMAEGASVTNGGTLNLGGDYTLASLNNTGSVVATDKSIIMTGATSGAGSITAGALTLQAASNTVGDLTLTGALTMGTAQAGSELTVAGDMEVATINVNNLSNILSAGALAGSGTNIVVSEDLLSTIVGTSSKQATLLTLETVDTSMLESLLTLNGNAYNEAFDSMSGQYNYTLVWDETSNSLVVKAGLNGSEWLKDADGNCWNASGEASDYVNGTIPASGFRDTPTTSTSVVFGDQPSNDNKVIVNGAAVAKNITVDRWDTTLDNLTIVGGKDTVETTADTITVSDDMTVSGLHGVIIGELPTLDPTTGEFATVNEYEDIKLSVGKTLTINEGAGVATGSDGTLEAGKLVLRGTYSGLGDTTIKGDVEIAENALMHSGAIVLDGGITMLPAQPGVDTPSTEIQGNLKNDGYVYSYPEGTMTVAGTTTNTGIIAVTGGTVTLGVESTGSDVTSLDNSGSVSVTDGELTVNGSMTNTGADSDVPGLEISGGVVDITGILNNSGALAVTGGTVTINGALANTGTATVEGGMVTLGSLDNDASMTVSGGSLTAGTADNSGSLTVTGGTVTINGALGNTGTATVEGGTVTLGSLDNDASMTVSGGSLTAGTADNSGSLTVTGGTVTLGAADTGADVISLTNSGTLTIGGTKGEDGKITANMVVKGSLNNTGGSIIIGSADTCGSLSVTGNLTGTGAKENLVVNSGSSLSVGGDLTATDVVLEFGGAVTVGGKATMKGLTISKDASFSAGDTLTVGDLTGTGKVEVANALIITGDITGFGGTLTNNGTWTVESTGTIGDLTLTTAGHSIAGTAGKVTVKDTAELSLLSGATLAGLDVTAGKVTLDGDTFDALTVTKGIAVNGADATLDLNDKSLESSPDITMTAGKLANASAWKGQINIGSAAEAVHVNLGGLTSAATLNVDVLKAGSTISGFESLTLAGDNVITLNKGNVSSGEEAGASIFGSTGSITLAENAKMTFDVNALLADISKWENNTVTVKVGGNLTDLFESVIFDASLGLFNVTAELVGKDSIKLTKNEVVYDPDSGKDDSFFIATDDGNAMVDGGEMVADKELVISSDNVAALENSTAIIIDHNTTINLSDADSDATKTDGVVLSNLMGTETSNLDGATTEPVTLTIQGNGKTDSEEKTLVTINPNLKHEENGTSTGDAGAVEEAAGDTGADVLNFSGNLEVTGADLQYKATDATTGALAKDTTYNVNGNLTASKDSQVIVTSGNLALNGTENTLEGGITVDQTNGTLVLNGKNTTIGGTVAAAKDAEGNVTNGEGISIAAGAAVTLADAAKLTDGVSIVGDSASSIDVAGSTTIEEGASISGGQLTLSGSESKLEIKDTAGLVQANGLSGEGSLVAQGGAKVKLEMAGDATFTGSLEKFIGELNVTGTGSQTIVLSDSGELSSRLTVGNPPVTTFRMFRMVRSAPSAPELKLDLTQVKGDNPAVTINEAVGVYDEGASLVILAGREDGKNSKLNIAQDAAGTDGTGVLTLGEGTNLTLSMNLKAGDADNTIITAKGIDIIGNGANVNVDVRDIDSALVDQILENKSITITLATATDSIEGKTTGNILDDSVIRKYLGDSAKVEVQGNSLVLTGSLVSSEDASWYQDNATTDNGKAGGKLLDYAFGSGAQADKDSDMADVLNTVEDMISYGSNRSDDVMASVAGASTAVLGMAAVGDVDRQLRAIRNRTTTMGVDQTVVNHDMPYFNAWINAEGHMSEMGDDGTLGGYKLNSWGGTVGFDVDLDSTFTAGLALTAMYGDLDATGADKATGNMDTTYVSAFARYCASAWTHTFVATVGMGDISLDRTVLGHELKGETESMSFGFMYEVGRVFALDEDATACIQPVFNVAWRHASVDGYTEKGSDLALEVGEQSLDTITFGLGARVQAVVGESMYNRTSIFECRLLAKADVGDRESAADVALGGVKAEVKSAETGAFGLEAGAGLTIPMGDEGSSIFMDASVELRADYTNVNGTVGYRINF